MQRRSEAVLSTVVAVVPARGGSKGVPGKNLARVAGRSLVARAVDACRAAEQVDLVVVSTDSPDIAAEAAAAGARVVGRPEQLSGDTASSESAVLHALDALAAEGVDPQVTLLVQCTSPFLRPADIDAAVRRVQAGAADSVLAAVETHEFLWRRSTDSTGVEGVNHDPASRPRRQDRAADHRETGGFYVMRTAGLRASGHRFFGRIDVQPVPASTALEVDVPEDLVLARALAPVVDFEVRGAGAGAWIDADVVVTDFDGVHTDDRVWVDQDGREAVTVSRSDGLGVERLLASGRRLLILSKERNPVVAARATKLRVPCLQAVDDKATALKAWLDTEGVDPDRVAYLGNDINDLGVLALVGWPVAVADAHPDVRAAARVVLSRPGEAGAVRDLCERVLLAQGNSSS